MNQNYNNNNETNIYKGNNGLSNNNQDVVNSNSNNIYYENLNNKENSSNNNKYSINERPQTSINLDNNENKGISKKGIVLMFTVLISTIIIFFDNFITSMNWYWNLQIQALYNQDDKLKLVLDTFSELISVVNWTIVVVITILSIIFLIIDKKKHSVRIYEWYIVAGIFHILIGTIALTPIIYSISTLIFSIKNKKVKNINVKSDKMLIIFSFIIIFSIIFMLIAENTNLFKKIENKVEDYKDTKEVIVEDKDKNHIVTTFDKILNDWGNNVTENKSYKINNVKLNNTTASLYIDYTFNLENDNPVSTITIKHGENNIYTYTEKTNYFNLSYLNYYDNLIIYGTSYCDNIDNGICEKHLTYSQVYAFNKDDSISIYDRTIINQENNITYFKETSVFLEDENVYAEPYNDFRVYDIKFNDKGIYFYTIVENYDTIFEYEYYSRKNNCNDPYWVSIDFDMQRIFKTNFIYNDKYKYYELDELEKQSSIKYADYCVNKKVLDF